MIWGTGDCNVGGLYPGKCADVRPFEAMREWNAFCCGLAWSSEVCPDDAGREKSSADPGLGSALGGDRTRGREKFEGPSNSPLTGSDWTRASPGSGGTSGSVGCVGDVDGDSSVSVSAWRVTSRLDSGGPPFRRLPRLYVVRVDRFKVPMPPNLPGAMAMSPSAPASPSALVPLEDMLIRRTISTGSSTMCSSSCRLARPPFGWCPDRCLSSRSAPSL